MMVTQMMRMNLFQLCLLCLTAFAVVNSFYIQGEDMITEESDFRFCYMRNCTTAVKLQDEAARYYSFYGSSNVNQGVNNYYCRVFGCSGGGSAPFVSSGGGYKRRRALLQQYYEHPDCHKPKPIWDQEYGPCCYEYKVDKDEGICDIARFFELDCKKLQRMNDLTQVTPYQLIQLC
eukprot:TRINITY_DN7884_c1_g1_i2.p1 TRINITY_DN7884_c1_g1~~TRINITY_DN7884_c1_g1_i2.p1  ORF type:complete len:176 (-),score=21.55 TRINITY_DN7884_c1_g1_i2:377-904(-)